MEKEHKRIVKDDRDIRVFWLESKFLNRWTKRQLKPLYMEQFNMSDATFAKDCKEALFNIREEISKDRDERMSLAVASREDIIKKAKESNKLDVAARVEKDLAELEGLYKGDGGGDVNVVFDFGGLPVASSLDGPVTEDEKEQYAAATEKKEEKEE